MGNIFLEIGIHAPNSFKEIDNKFKELKLEKDRSKQHKLIVGFENTLEHIFGTTFSIELQHMGSYTDNCAILPQYSKTGKLSYKDKIIQLGNINKIYMILGVDLIKESTPRELTAILLHEIGHIVNHSSQTILKIQKLFSNISSFIDPFNKIPIIGGIFFPLLLIVTRTMHWTEHVGEYNADKFPIQYGYGDELASVIHKWDLQYCKDKNKVSLLQKIGIFKDILLGSTHPGDSKRIKNIVNEIKLNYSKKYKSKRLNNILDYYSLR